MEALYANLEQMLPVATLWMQHYETIAAKSDLKIARSVQDLRQRIGTFVDDIAIYEPRIHLAIQQLNTQNGLSAVADLLNLELMLPKEGDEIDADESSDTSTYGAIKAQIISLLGCPNKVAPDDTDDIEQQRTTVTHAPMQALQYNVIQVRPLRSGSASSVNSDGKIVSRDNSLTSSHSASKDSSDNATKVDQDTHTNRKDTNSTEEIYPSDSKKRSSSAEISHHSTPEKQFLIEETEENLDDEALFQSIIEEHDQFEKEEEEKAAHLRVTQNIADAIFSEVLEDEVSSVTMKVDLDHMVNKFLSQ